MANIITAALLQTDWTGDKESMIQKHEQYAHQAAKDGAQFILFQELFYGPYFCQVQDTKYYEYTELIPDGPTTRRMEDLAKQTAEATQDIKDRIANIQLCLDGEACADRREIVRWITPYWRAGDQRYVIDASPYPTVAQQEEARATRRIGVGVTGLADALIGTRGVKHGQLSATTTGAGLT